METKECSGMKGKVGDIDKIYSLYQRSAAILGVLAVGESFFLINFFWCREWEIFCVCIKKRLAKAVM